MKFLRIELSEQDIIFILNALSYFRNEINWHDSLEQKRKISLFFNFIDNDEFIEQYSRLDFLHRRISTFANKYLYNTENDIYFQGQCLYSHKRDFSFIDFNKYEYIDPYKTNNHKNILNLKKLLDISKKIV